MVGGLTLLFCDRWIEHDDGSQDVAEDKNTPCGTLPSDEVSMTNVSYTRVGISSPHMHSSGDKSLFCPYFFSLQKYILALETPEASSSC